MAKKGLDGAPKRNDLFKSWLQRQAKRFGFEAKFAPWFIESWENKNWRGCCAWQREKKQEKLGAGIFFLVRS